MPHSNLVAAFRSRALKRGYSAITIRKVKFCRDELGYPVRIDEPIYFVSLCEPFIAWRLEFVCYEDEFDVMLRTGQKASSVMTETMNRRLPATESTLLEVVSVLMKNSK
ncbi:MAG: hypothetical protein K2G25_05300 [Oscillospiraceae bacterium]|nr:hypothetical protein [Oscillospiraceae bacterium]